jgi:hypothetical protein
MRVACVLQAGGAPLSQRSPYRGKNRVHSVNSVFLLIVFASLLPFAFKHLIHCLAVQRFFVLETLFYPAIFSHVVSLRLRG